MASSKTLITFSSPSRLANCIGFPLGVDFKTSLAKPNGVRPLSSSISGSAPSSIRSRATPGFTYPAAMCRAEKPPLLSLWSKSAPASARIRTHGSEPSPDTKRRAVRPSWSTASMSRPTPISASASAAWAMSCLRAASSAFLAAVHQGVSNSATTSFAIGDPRRGMIVFPLDQVLHALPSFDCSTADDLADFSVRLVRIIVLENLSL
ncbi:LOW QUALITY PROTEIN: hypothetical protein RJ641_019655 [Dillenia turbinata]|uniref:Uncharacterized protein n=1 Tax=Dillenia turbinata TaxID=194707 RepID=A0AAN8UMD7_9MAGN